MTDGWSNKQKQIAGMACTEAGIDDAERKFILRQFRRAMFDRDGNAATEPSSTSPKLTNADFERFMAIVEDRAGGKVLHFTAGYWQGKSASRSTHASERQAHRIHELYDQFARQTAGGLRGHGTYGLDGLIRRVSNGRTHVPEKLTPREGHNMIEMLSDLIRRRGPASPPSAERQARLFSDHEPADRYTTVGPPPKQRRGRRHMTDDDIPF